MKNLIGKLHNNVELNYSELFYVQSELRVKQLTGFSLIIHKKESRKPSKLFDFM